MQSSVAHRLTIVLGIALSPSLSQAEDDAKTAFFMTQVKPLIEGACIHCHGPDEAEGDYRMDNREAAIAGGDSWPDETIVAGDPDAECGLLDDHRATRQPGHHAPEEAALGRAAGGAQEVDRRWSGLARRCHP